MVRVGILKASGYGGGELLRLLAGHPQAQLAYVTSETYRGKSIADAFPGLKGVVDLPCEAFDLKAACESADCFFLTTSNGEAMKLAPSLLAAGKKVIDLSADFRFKSRETYEKWYEIEHQSPELLDEAAYGLPEINREAVMKARLVANPGCYVTASLLALLPLVSGKRVDPASLIVDAKSGVSGAGRSSFKLDYHFPELNESVRAYNIAGQHRHTPEIEQILSLAAGSKIILSFTPHLISITRGIHATCYADLSGRESTADLLALYSDFYSQAPFVVMLSEGEYPSTKSTFGSNFCQISLKVDERTNRVVVCSVLDNLVKGAAGQAVQNMNLMYGIEETAGLMLPAVFP
ncbi:MAG: N-acetyl-gamma-glutamyl-phosphate reductase [Armatimonadetes bacterium]|nr:N-acetyl-gamma-glutamyl-phosphate reductase [Armatimonadota bacterium]